MSTSPDRPSFPLRSAENYAPEQIKSEAFDHLGVAVAQLTVDGTLLTVNSRLCEVLGRSKDDLLEKNLREVFRCEEPWSECASGLSRLIAGEINRYSTDMSAERPDGQSVSVAMVFSVVRDDVTEMPRSLIAVATDITPLKQAMRELNAAASARDELSQRMMSGQEADRTHVARELHDDIGQSLAVLKIQMLRAGQPVSGRPNQVHPGIRDLVGKLEAIMQKVSHLSHDLHSSELEYLGLAVAVEGLCRECSTQLRIPVQCQCIQVQDRLNGIIALAFLRVVQEALHNVAKHSDAKSVSVTLTGSDRDLTLEICDDGVGFDIERARLAAGLGLISMRERIHLIGGKFEVWSSAGEGTRITARAPVVKV